MFKLWFLAARPKTLFVSFAPVMLGSVLAFYFDTFRLVPALVCMIFALLAQIASNLINDYADFRKGADRDDRVGPERLVASGKIAPRQMLMATFITLGVALMFGLILLFYGGFWLVGVGALVAIFAYGYSCGPYPLSYHGLGDVAVLVFFGLVPVTLTYYVQAHGNPLAPDFPLQVILASLATGMVAVNLLVVNNYRDMEADIVSGKRTTVVIFGRNVMSMVYSGNCLLGYAAGFFILPDAMKVWALSGIPFALFSFRLRRLLTSLQGTALNKVLGMSALNVLVYVICLSIAIVASK